MDDFMDSAVCMLFVVARDTWSADLMDEALAAATKLEPALETLDDESIARVWTSVRPRLLVVFRDFVGSSSYNCDNKDHVKVERVYRRLLIPDVPGVDLATRLQDALCTVMDFEDVIVVDAIHVVHKLGEYTKTGDADFMVQWPDLRSRSIAILDDFIGCDFFDATESLHAELQLVYDAIKTR